MTIKVFVCDADAWIDKCGSYCSDGLSFGEFDEKYLYSNVFLFDFLTNLFIDQDTEISRHKLYKYLAMLSGKNSWEISFVILLSYGNLLFFGEGCWGYIKHTVHDDLFWHVVRILYNTTWLIKKIVELQNCFEVRSVPQCISRHLGSVVCFLWKFENLVFTVHRNEKFILKEYYDIVLPLFSWEWKKNLGNLEFSRILCFTYNLWDFFQFLGFQNMFLMRQ